MDPPPTHAATASGQHGRGDALHQRAVEQVVRQHHNLLHAEHALALNRLFQARVSDAGEGEVHQIVVGFLQQPARHLGHVAVGLPVRRTAPQQHHAGGAGVGHVERLHRALEAAAQDGQDRVAGTQVRRIQELHQRELEAGAIDGLRNVHLHVARRVQDQWHHHHAAGAGGGALQALAHGDLGKLDEADLDAPARLALAPLFGEGKDLVVARGFARAVAHQQNGFGVHGASDVRVEAGTLARRKRWVKLASYSLDFARVVHWRAPSVGLAITMDWLAILASRHRA